MKSLNTESTRAEREKAAGGRSELRNLVAVVTGAASGIGRALAKTLAANGCHLALADIDPRGLAETISLLPSTCKATSYELDVSNREAYQAFVRQVISDHQHVDIVINNAGRLRLHSVQAGEYSEYELSLNVNFWGMLYGCKEFLPYLKTRPNAWLVNMSSGAGLVAFENYSSYNVAKFAVRGLTECLRNELRNTNIVVSCVFPGGVDTKLLDSCVYSPDAARSADALRGVLKRMSADEAAEIIVQGMLKKRGKILVGRDARILDMAARLFPEKYDLVLAKSRSKLFSDAMGIIVRMCSGNSGTWGKFAHAMPTIFVFERPALIFAQWLSSSFAEIVSFLTWTYDAIAMIVS